MMELDIEEALYAAADSTRKTPEYSEHLNSTPTIRQILKFKTQLRRFLEACPEHTTVLELLEELK